MQQLQLKTGLRGILSHEVAATDLATSWRNDVPVLATPILLWLAELACMRAIEGALEPSQMTLGYGHEVQHLAPTPQGWTVQLEATLTQIDGKLLTFRVSGTDGLDTVLLGQHTRAIVDRGRFVARVEAKASADAPVVTARQQ